MGALDFAGGTVVHINAGVAGLVGAYLIGKRLGWGREVIRPHSLTMTMIGASLLWFGWFGFNAGSALEANASAALAFLNTYLATACAVLAWTFAEWILKGKPSMLGAASGAVAGLVAITPAAGNVGIPGAFAIGIAAGVVCLWGVTGLKRCLKADDSLDVFGVHAVGGITGALLTGIFNAPDLGGPGSVQDWVTMTSGYPGIAAQFLIQLKAVAITVVWTRRRRVRRLQDRRPARRPARHRRAGARRARHQLARRIGVRLLIAGAGRSGGAFAKLALFPDRARRAQAAVATRMAKPSSNHRESRTRRACKASRRARPRCSPKPRGCRSARLRRRRARADRRARARRDASGNAAPARPDRCIGAAGTRKPRKIYRRALAAHPDDATLIEPVRRSQGRYRRHRRRVRMLLRRATELAPRRCRRVASARHRSSTSTAITKKRSPPDAASSRSIRIIGSGAC